VCKITAEGDPAAKPASSRIHQVLKAGKERKDEGIDGSKTTAIHRIVWITHDIPRYS
jgi:hypothetical protein